MPNTVNTIGVINLGLGNIRSVLNMFSYLGIPAQEVNHPDLLVGVDRLILPGVGHFDRAMAALEQQEWISRLKSAVFEQNKPLLGICLGMQVLSLSSEEGTRAGLGWISARFHRFQFERQSRQRVPHMGWNAIAPQQPHPLLQDLDQARFYFVHSYYGLCQEQTDVLATTDYGLTFVSAYLSRSIMGVQFHPEKSHRFGMRLLKNFAEARF